MAPAVKVSPRPPLPRGRVWCWSAALLLGVSGCTICPDPFDYSGPVPNGSAPQNDFRARSNGIAPTGGVPRPWPPVVQREPAPADDPSRAETATEMATAPVPETDASTVAATPTADPDVIILPAALETPPGHDEAADSAAPLADVPALEEIPVPAEPTQPEPEPAAGETPGWRSRG